MALAAMIEIPATERRSRLRPWVDAPPLFNLYGQRSNGRPEVESYIKARFSEIYAADIASFSPLLFTLSHGSQRQAAIGLRPAATESLFLEHYLNQPIEDELRQQLGLEVDRSRMVELGNLVATSRGASQLVFLILHAVLSQVGYRWAVFTATPEVNKLLARLQLNPIVLGPADGMLLGEEVSQWGSYYRKKPSITVLDIATGLQHLSEHRLSSGPLRQLEPEIQSLAGQFFPLLNE